MFLKDKFSEKGFSTQYDPTEQLNQIFQVPCAENYLEFCKLITETEELKEYVRPGHEELREFMGPFYDDCFGLEKSEENNSNSNNSKNYNFQERIFNRSNSYSNIDYQFSESFRENETSNVFFKEHESLKLADPLSFQMPFSDELKAEKYLRHHSLNLTDPSMRCPEPIYMNPAYRMNSHHSPYNNKKDSCFLRHPPENSDDSSVSKSDDEKPEESYAYMIYKALESSENQTMTLNEIYLWIENNYPYYQTADAIWKNSIRHNLSLNPAFKKVPRPSHVKGKGGYWKIDHEGQKTVRIQKKRRASRSLQHNKYHKPSYSIYDSNAFRC